MAKNYGSMNKALHAKMGTEKGRKSVFRSIERMPKLINVTAKNAHKYLKKTTKSDIAKSNKIFDSNVKKYGLASAKHRAEQPQEYD